MTGVGIGIPAMMLAAGMTAPIESFPLALLTGGGNSIRTRYVAYDAAKLLIDIDVSSHFYAEDNMGIFENFDGVLNYWNG